VDTALGAEVDHQPMFTPEPDHIVAGRPILYDSRRPTANGETSCASCHIFGDTDHLSWDLGDPAVPVADSPIPIQLGFAAPGAVNGGADVDQFHALKGPMFTQSLRGMVNAGAMHWRGDRSNGTFGVDAFDARLSFKNFDVAFDGLLGDEVVPSSAEMDRFADFALAMFYPPNPVRALDNGLSPAEQRAHDLYMTRTVDTQTCNGCHTLEAADGHFGTNGEASFEAEAQIFKIPHLRNLYTRVGMFGMPDVDFASLAGDNAHQGPQVRGYGFTHDGSVDTLFHFFRATVFNNIDDADRRDIEALMLAFDSDVAPAVGQQVTLSSPFDPVDVARTQLLLDRAAAPFTSLELGGAVTECDVVAHVRAGGRQVGMLWDPASSQFLPDTLSLSPFGLGGLANFLRNTGAAATVTCLPPGEGVRVALDRDLDGILDGDE
jgi:mono/diheme cytochrome c family protein